MQTESKHPFEKANLGTAPFRCIGYRREIFQACYGAPIQPGASCAYCGTGIMHVYVIKSADGRTSMVGCDCVLKTDLKLHAEVKAVRKAARLAVIATERAKRTEVELAKMFERFPGLREALTCQHPIVQNIAAKFAASKWISVSQAALVVRLAEEAAIRAQLVFVADPPSISVPVSTGRVEITGKIVHYKTVESMYGAQLKMLLVVRKPEGAWKAWSTVPAALRPIEKGQIVTLKARVKISQDDPSFAFLSRPTVAKTG